MSLDEAMRRYAAEDNLRLHTPGHKGELEPRDLTELTDGSFPDKQLAEAEKTVAEIYGVRHAKLLSCGSSQGVKAAIYFAGGNGIIDVNSHRSVFDGFKLSGGGYTAVGRKGSVEPVKVEDICAAYTPDIKTVVVTSPTYFGYCADIAAVKRFCDKKGLTLIVDGAHGAHFGFSPRLPKSVAALPAVMNVSVHKTLSALTQSAVLLDNLDDAEHARLVTAAELMGTTSPSYLLYASAENAVVEARNAAAAYEALIDAIVPLREKYAFLKNDDPTRLVLDCAAEGVDARSLNAELARRGVMSELVTERYIVFLFTAADTPDGVLRLDGALQRSLRTR